MKLGKLVLEGALKQQITFEQLPDGCVDLGFMNVTTKLYLGRKSVASYSFFHLTLQEFLAAFYASQLPVGEQKLLCIENMEVDKANLMSSRHLDVLWRFMAGLIGFSVVGWELICKTTQMVRVPLSLIFYYGSRSYLNLHYDLLLIHCLFEIQNEQSIKTACDVIAKFIYLST